MSYSFRGRTNVGAYDRPFSGVGIEFYPLGIKPERSGITLHESGYLPANAQWNFPNVFSPFWRLCYNAQGGHCVLFGDRIVELTPDHIMLIPDHCTFHCLGEHPVPAFWIAFSFARKLRREVDIPVLLPPRDTELCLIRDLKALIADDETWQPNDSIYRNSLALLQVVMARPELRWQPPIPDNLVNVISYIESHIDENLNNKVLAKVAAMSLSSFARSFKQHYGVTPARMITELRVREAAHRLLHDNESIDAVAEATGFPNRAYFSRVFKRVTSESPAAYRRKHTA